MPSRFLTLVLLVLGICVLLAGTVAAACPSEVEPNDDPMQGDVMGSIPDSVCGMGTIYPADDTDFWAFEVTEPGLKVRVETGGLYDGDTVIILFNSDGEQIAADDDSGEGTFSRIDLGARGIALPVGYYLVAVTDAQRSFSSSAPYILSVTGERPAAETEETPAGESPCYVQNCTTVRLTWLVHYWDNVGEITSDQNCAGGELRWSGNQFTAAETKSSGDPATFKETTEVSLSGEVSADCGVAVFLKASYHYLQWRNGQLEFEDTVEITVRGLPLQGPEWRVPASSPYANYDGLVKGKAIAAYITEFLVRRVSSGLTKTCIAIDPQDNPEYPDHLLIYFRI